MADAVQQREVSTVRTPFRVVDEQGRLLLEVAGGPAGGQLRLFDLRGEVVAVLGATGAGGTLGIYNPAGQLVAALTVNEEAGGGTVGVNNAAGENRGLFFADNDGGHVGTANAAGHHAVVLSGSRDGGRVDVYDRDGNLITPPPPDLQPRDAAPELDVPESFSEVPGATAHHS
jgi:hypothetical protein